MKGLIVASVLAILITIPVAYVAIGRGGDPVCGAAQDAVLRNLRSPSTADFKSCTYLEVSQIWRRDACERWADTHHVLQDGWPNYCHGDWDYAAPSPTYLATVRVDAQNAFGATVRSVFVVEVAGSRPSTMLLREP